MAKGATTTRERTRELAYRESDGVHVTLFWREADDGLVVIVVDERMGTAFSLEPERDQALAVFNHPFAYA
ncbi:MAG: hypothetical protein MSC30_06795 [Gaiellaceae bacterium MAG52_C11]|nr:hypothetical protein [Candidatus Gaiellasilicea maunaloa]